MNWDEFVNNVQKGQVDLDELNHVIKMYELYKNSSPELQVMVEHLLEEGSSQEATQQD